MVIIRIVQEKDFDALMQLSEESGVGFTTLVSDKTLIRRKITTTLESLAAQTKNGYYFFVCEDNGVVVGCSAIDVMPGKTIPFYMYKLSLVHQYAEQFNLHSHYKLLQLVNDFENETELCSLFLLEKFRHKFNGYLLSYARFLYMALYPEKFTDTVFAEIRGFSDDNGRSPFWEAVGKHFYHMDFAAADKLTGLGEKSFINALKPPFPVCVNLLPREAQDVIGVPHPLSAPAMHLLKRQGFFGNDYVDIFDAGPMLMAKTPQIYTINQAKQYVVGKVLPKLSHQKNFLVAKIAEPFCVTHAKLNIMDDKVCMEEITAKTLHVDIGERVIAAPLI